MGWTLKRGSKFGAKRTDFNGRKYDSKKEAGYAKELDLLKKAKQIVDYRPQVTLQLFANGQKITRYRTDFEVTKKGGTIEFHEVKGFRTSVFDLKWSLLEANLDMPEFREYNGYSPEVELKMIMIQ